MKDSNFIVRIPEPCHEDWNKMQPDAKGKFCGSCSKSVFDFSNKTDIEIRDILIEYKNQKVCGHFKKTQIDRPLNIRIDFNNLPKNMSATKTFAIALFLVFGTLLFSCTDANAQKVGKIKIVNTIPEERIVGQMVAIPQELIKGDTIMEPDSIVKPIICEQNYIDGGVSYEEVIVETITIGEVEAVMIDSVSGRGNRKMGIIEESIPKDTTSINKVDSTLIEKSENITDQPAMNKQTNFGIYPNPSNGEFTIKYNVLKRANIRVDILDIQGALVRTVVNVAEQYEGKYQIPVNVSELTNGIYIVSLINNGKRITEKLLIEK